MINILVSKTPFYNGDGATASFVYGFRIDDVSHLKVYVDGVLQAYPTNYSVTGVGDDVGGTFVFNGGFIPPVGVGNVVALRLQNLVQLLQLSEGRVGMERLERRGLDPLLEMLQEQQERDNRTPKVQPYLDIPNIFIPSPGAGEVWAWNDAGDGMKLISLANIDAIAFFSDVIGAGATTATLTHSLNSATAKLASPVANWNAGAVWLTGQALNSFSVQWPNAAPGGGGALTWGAVL